MKLLELFAGTHTLSDTFKDRGWETYTVDWNEELDVDLHADVGKLTVDDVIKLCNGVPDVVWVSPDCTTYSIAGIGHHRYYFLGKLCAKSEYAALCDKINVHVIELIQELLKMGTKYYFIENPRGGMRKMEFMKPLPRYTVTYCKYGETRMKPTDIWTNHPDPKFIPPCKQGDKCHESSPRSSKKGTQSIDCPLLRAKLPKLLCEHIEEICRE